MYFGGRCIFCAAHYIYLCACTFYIYKYFVQIVKIFAKLFGYYKKNVYICSNKQFKQIIQHIGTMETLETKVVSVDIMRGEFFYATFHHKCRLLTNRITGEQRIDTEELMSALYARYPSVKGNTKYNIIIN